MENQNDVILVSNETEQYVDNLLEKYITLNRKVKDL
jgi:hypothetical protein